MVFGLRPGMTSSVGSQLGQVVSRLGMARIGKVLSQMETDWLKAPQLVEIALHEAPQPSIRPDGTAA